MLTTTPVVSQSGKSLVEKKYAQGSVGGGCSWGLEPPQGFGGVGRADSAEQGRSQSSEPAELEEECGPDRERPARPQGTEEDLGIWNNRTWPRVPVWWTGWRGMEPEE